jgi:hypothetical protein
MTAPPLPEALALLAHKRGVNTDAWDSRGNLNLRIDDRVRIKLSSGRRPQEVMLEARIAELPATPAAGEALLARAMLHVTAGAALQVGVLVLPPDGHQLLLQAGLDGSDPERFETALAHFLNELDRWIAVVGAEQS